MGYFVIAAKNMPHQYPSDTPKRQQKHQTLVLHQEFEFTIPSSEKKKKTIYSHMLFHSSSDKCRREILFKIRTLHVHPHVCLEIYIYKHIHAQSCVETDIVLWSVSGMTLVP